MTSDELISELERAGNVAADSEDREVIAAAAVLMALAGALCAGRAELLMVHVLPFADAECQRLSAGRN